MHIAVFYALHIVTVRCNNQSWSVKKDVFKDFEKNHRKTPVLESLF